MAKNLFKTFQQTRFTHRGEEAATGGDLQAHSAPLDPHTSQGSARAEGDPTHTPQPLTRVALDGVPGWREAVAALLASNPRQVIPRAQLEALEASLLSALNGLLEQNRISDLNWMLAQWVQYISSAVRADGLTPEPLFAERALEQQDEPLFDLMRALAPLRQEDDQIATASLARSFAEMGASQEATMLFEKISISDLKHPLAQLDHAICALVLDLGNGRTLLDRSLAKVFATPFKQDLSARATLLNPQSHPALAALETIGETQYRLLERGNHRTARQIALALQAHVPTHARVFKSKAKRALAAAIYTRRYRAIPGLLWGMIAGISLPGLQRKRHLSLNTSILSNDELQLHPLLAQVDAKSLERDQPLAVLLARMAVQRWRVGVSKTLRHLKAAIKSRIFPEPASSEPSFAKSDDDKPVKSSAKADSEAIASEAAENETKTRAWTVLRVWHALLSTFRGTGEQPDEEIEHLRAHPGGGAHDTRDTLLARLAKAAGTIPPDTGWRGFRDALAKRIIQTSPATAPSETAGLLHAFVQVSCTAQAAPGAVSLLSMRLLDRGLYRLAADLSEPTNDRRTHKSTLLLNFLVRHSDEITLDWPTTLDRWWQRFEAAEGLKRPYRYMPLRQIWLEMAQHMISQDALERAEDVLAKMCHLLTGDSVAFMLRAQIADRKGDHRNGMKHWQMAATLAKPSNIKLGRHRVKPGRAANKLLSQANFGLRASRGNFALQLLSDGHERAFIELVSRIMESTGTEATIQKDPILLDLLATYLRHCLAPTRPIPASLSPTALPRRIGVCLDVLKFSDFHLHSRVIFTISRSLLDHYPDLEIRLFITNERFAITRPNIGSWMDFAGNEKTLSYARKTLAGHFGTRFVISFEEAYALESLVQTSTKIIDFAPDVMLFAGGHGRYSNDSRIIRHTLFPYFPSALFFLGVDNEVDDRVDMIIPRGPHEIVGDPGEATIRIQTYPTLPDGDERVKHPDEKPQPRFIVSALAGERFDTRLRGMADEDLRHLLSILDRNPEVVWHFVGANDPRRLVADVPLLKPYTRQGRLVVHPIMELNTFREFVTDATLFVQLPGFKGGAGGAGMARRGGVPVLTFANSDVSGRQPPETVFEEGDVAGMANFAAYLLANPAEAGRVTQSQFDYAEHIRETSVSGFFDCLVDTMALAAQRSTRVQPEPARRRQPATVDEDEDED